MESQIRNGGTSDGKLELPVDGLTSVSESAGKDCSSDNLYILDEMDSYMEEVNARLIVSRMVNNSVIKGMVGALEQECAEKISSEELVTNLDSKLENYTVVENCKKNPTFMEENLVFSHSKFKLSALSHVEYVERLRIEVEEWIQNLKEEVGRAMRTNHSQADALHAELGCSRNDSQLDAIDEFETVKVCIHSLEMLLTEMISYVGARISSDKTLICEQQSEKDILIDDGAAMLRNRFTDLHHDYEAIIHARKTLMHDLNEKWQRKSDELVTLRRELDDLHKSFMSWEPGLLFPHFSHEISKEQNVLKKKDKLHWKQVGNNSASYDENSPVVIERVEELDKPINVDSPQLMWKTKEELISYFKTEMTKMKRQHDVDLQEKTEEWFSHKREFFKDKGPGHLNFKKDKEAELIGKKIAEAVSKLDDIVTDNKNMSTNFYDEGLCSFRKKINGILLENQRLVSLLATKQRGTLPDCSKDSNTSNQLPNIFVGLEDVEQMEKLQWDMEALKIKMSIEDGIKMVFLRQSPCELRDRAEVMEMATQVGQSIYSFILREVIWDIISRMNTVIMKCYEVKNSVSANLLEKKKELCLEINKNEVLKQQIESSSTLLKMKEKVISDLEAAVMQRSEQFDSICHERDMLRDQVINQEMIIAKSKKESDLLKRTLEDKFHEVNQHQAEINKINLHLKTVSESLSDAEKQKSILRCELMENQAELSSEIEKGKKQRKQVELMITSSFELSKSWDELELKIIDTVECGESRCDYILDHLVLTFKCLIKF